MERRLVAILAADVVGYSHLMGEDEAGTLDRLKALRKELVQPKIRERKGRIVKLMGDGLLAEFPSVVEAVQCAGDIQDSMSEREADLPDDQRIRLRIGVNLGDIIVEGSDIYGDGVNVAARLEALADPGGICISGSVFDQVKGKVDLGFEDRGEQEVKNIAEPVQVYRVLTDAPAIQDVRSSSTVLPLPDKPSIAVLPFTNMSGDPEQEYFSDGITEDIITELSRFRSLFVIARNSSFHYKGQSPKVHDLGRELGVAYVVEGSVRKAGNRVRVTTQLVEAASGNHLWAERYDRDLEDIFAIQDDLTRTIVSTVAGRIEVVGHRRASRTNADGLEAYDLVLRARRHCYAFTKPDNAKAKKLLERAIALDPSNARAHAALANCHHLDWISHWAAVGDESLNEAHRLAKRAVELDGTDSYAQWTLGCTYMFERRYQNSRLHVERALELNPNDVEARALYGMILTNIGETNEAMAAYREAELVDPHHLSWMPWYWGWTYFTVSRFNEAIEALERIEQPHLEILALLAASYAYVGRSKEASRALNSLLSVAEKEMVDPPGRSATAWARDWNTLQSYKDDALREVLAAGLRKAGLDP